MVRAHALKVADVHLAQEHSRLFKNAHYIPRICGGDVWSSRADWDVPGRVSASVCEALLHSDGPFSGDLKSRIHQIRRRQYRG